MTPVLLEHEVSWFPPEYVRQVEVEGYVLSLVRRNDDGMCVFLIDGLCGIYEERPLECKLYPYLLDFSQGFTGLKLDSRFCQRIETMDDLKVFSVLIHKVRPSARWIAAYEALEGC